MNGYLLLGLVCLSVPMGCTAETDTCNSADYNGLVGANIAAISLPADLETRIIRQGDLVTSDYVAERLNILVDGQGRVESLSCG